MLFAALVPLVAGAQLSVGVERPVSAPALETLQRAGTIDAASSGENILIVWTDRRTDRGSDLVAARLDRFGAIRDVAGFPVTATPGIDEDTPFVQASGTDFILLWSSEGNTLAAKIDPNGVISQGPLVLAPGQPEALIAMERDLAVATADESGTTISLLRSDLTTSELKFIPRRTRVEMTRLGTGLVVTWTEFEFPSNRAIVKAMRIDNRGRTIDTVTITAFGNFATAPGMVLRNMGNDAIISAAGGNKLVVARMLPDGSTMPLHSVEDSTPRTVEDIVLRSDGFDLLATVGERARILRFTGDVLSSESTPLPGTAKDGAGVVTLGRTYTIWQIDGSILGRFALAAQTELPLLISKTYPSQQQPALASDGSGLLAAWSEDIDETRDRIVVRALALDGSADGRTPVTIATRAMSPFTSAPAVSATSGGGYAVAWVDQKRGPDKAAQLIVERVSRDGAPGPEVVVSLDAHTTETPALAGDLIVWTQKLVAGSQVKAAPVSQPSLDIDVPEIVSRPAVVSGNGAYLVAGTTARGTVRASLVSPGGTLGRFLFETLPPSGTTDTDAAAAWNGRSSYLVVFRRNVSIFARLLDAEGNTVGSEFPITTSGIAGRPRVAWDGYAFVVAWSVRPTIVTTDDADLFTARVLPNGTVGAPVALSATARNDDAPALAGVGFGRTVAAYQRMAGELQNVHRAYTRVLTTPAPAPSKRRAVR